MSSNPSLRPREVPDRPEPFPQPLADRGLRLGRAGRRRALVLLLRPEETFKALGGNTHLSLFVALASVVTIVAICASYSQIISLFPTGGGGYLVASKLLSPATGVVSGCALLIDYVLTVTISVASGADALFSLFPPACAARFSSACEAALRARRA
jgi:hypothetical protein